MSDVSGLNELVADLTAAPFKARAQARAIVAVGAKNIRDQARRTSTGMAHAPAYPSSITYDIEEKGIGQVEAEIGPDKNRPQGALGNLIEYGSVNNPPNYDLGAALDREGPGFTKAMAEAAGRVL